MRAKAARHRTRHRPQHANPKNIAFLCRGRTVPDHRGGYRSRCRDKEITPIRAQKAVRHLFELRTHDLLPADLLVTAPIGTWLHADSARNDTLTLMTRSAADMSSLR